MSLQTGTELISLSLLLNKIPGIYGLLAILTGYAISALQLSMYIYSVLCVGILVFLVPHIRRQTPFHNLALAWLYVLDTAVNAAFTTSFAVSWYMAGFYNPNGTAGADAATGTTAGDAAAAAARRDETDPAAPAAEDAATVAQAHDTAVSMVLIVALTLVRVYFAAVVAAHARGVVLRFVEGRPRARGAGDDDDYDEVAGRAANPFAVGTAEGEGWRGRLGRAMVAVGAGYWLGVKEDEEWTRDVGNKFSSRRGRGAAAERPE